MKVKQIAFLVLLPVLGIASVALGQATNIPERLGLPAIIPIPDDEVNISSEIQRVTSIDPSIPVEVNGEPPFVIGSQIERNLKVNNIQFSTAVLTDELPVSADEAVELANAATASELTRQPIKITVDYVGYTDPSRGFQDKKVWKVTYWGSPMLLEGPAPAPGKSRQVEQPSSQRAITWVLIDPELGETTDPITTFSSGPVRD